MINFENEMNFEILEERLEMVALTSKCQKIFTPGGPTSPGPTVPYPQPPFDKPISY